MRFLLKIQQAQESKDSIPSFLPEWIEKILPVKNSFQTETISLDTFHYETNDKSIVEINWDNPYYNDDDYFIFISGYIFNRIEEADKRGKYVPSPKEVLEVVLSQGNKHFDVLKGNYHIILFDKKLMSVIIYTSPLSLYPAWYMLENNILYVSNITESLIRMKKNPELDHQGLAEFTLFDHCLDSRTIYKGIFQLVSGTKLTINNKVIESELVYDLSRWITKNPIKRRDSLSEINRRLKRHISEYTSSVKKFNLSLTGGFDGRLNFSFISPKDYSRLQTFSYGMKDSLQIYIPTLISSKLGFKYNPIYLDQEFENQYAKLGFDSIVYSGGITPFGRANYPYSYGKISEFSKNCILGQCDMIRPLYNNPAGSIFNIFSFSLFYKDYGNSFEEECKKLRKNGYLSEEIFTEEIIQKIKSTIQSLYIKPYTHYSENERFFLFLYKESILKYWNTECHLVDLFVNDFISFSDLDYIEYLSTTEYFGLYKGVFAKNQFSRRRGQDLYADLMHLNNNALNNIILDRLFKPKWLRYPPFGYLMIAFGKWKAKQRIKKLGNDTFGGEKWSNQFFNMYSSIINKPNKYFNVHNLQNNRPYQDHNNHIYNRHISLKIWLHYIGLE